MTGSALFSPLTLRDVTLKNRIMVSPMWQYCAEKGYPTDWHLMNLGRLADGGAGLVFQEGTSIERRACGTVGDLGIWDDCFIEPLKRLVNLVCLNGGVPAIQLVHAGRKARQVPPYKGRGPLLDAAGVEDWDDWEMIAPSALPASPGFSEPRAMNAADIASTVEAWGASAQRADQAGYQVMELHGAHGYLIHQFLSSSSNRRSDGYGGDFYGRTRYIMEVVEEVRRFWPAGKPLLMRLSCFDGDGWKLEDTLRLVPMLAKAGVDLIDCSAGGISGSPLKGDRPLSYGYQVELAEAVKRETGVPTAAVGLIVHARHAEQIVQSGAADLVALGRELIYNPNWPVDAAQKLGVDPDFQVMQRRSSFWLDRRAKTVPGLTLSTYGEDESA